MANSYQSASRDLLIEELDQVHEITEEELATVSVACTCTSSINFSDTPAGDSSVAFDDAMDVETSSDISAPVMA